MFNLSLITLALHLVNYPVYDFFYETFRKQIWVVQYLEQKVQLGKVIFKSSFLQFLVHSPCLFIKLPCSVFKFLIRQFSPMCLLLRSISLLLSLFTLLSEIHFHSFSFFYTFSFSKSSLLNVCFISVLISLINLSIASLNSLPCPAGK